MSRVYLEHRDAHHAPGAADVAVALRRAAEAVAKCDALLFTAGAGRRGETGERNLGFAMATMLIIIYVM